MRAVVDGLWIVGMLEEVRGCMLANWSAGFWTGFGLGWRRRLEDVCARAYVDCIRQSGKVLRTGCKHKEVRSRQGIKLGYDED